MASGIKKEGFVMKKSAAFGGTGLGVAVLLLFFLMGPSGAQGDEKIVKLSSLEWPPYIGAEMENQGYVAEAVRAAFDQAGVRLMRADWTNRDPSITAALERHGRNGVPLYLLYTPGQGQPRVLPELLTPGIVLDALAPLRKTL